MKNYTVSVSVNDEEYWASVTIRANELKITEDCAEYEKYPCGICVDGILMVFDEHIVEIRENDTDKVIY